MLSIGGQPIARPRSISSKRPEETFGSDRTGSAAGAFNRCILDQNRVSEGTYSRGRADEGAKEGGAKEGGAEEGGAQERVVQESSEVMNIWEIYYRCVYFSVLRT